MTKSFIRRSHRVEPEDLNRQTAAVNAKLEEEGPRMNSIANYLERRKDQNGFGADFEYTLRPRGAS